MLATVKVHFRMIDGSTTSYVEDLDAKDNLDIEESINNMTDTILSKDYVTIKHTNNRATTVMVKYIVAISLEILTKGTNEE